MAFVILRPQHSSEWAGRDEAFAAALKQYARTRLPGFACPEWVMVVSELPVSHFYLCGQTQISRQKTSTGKIVKTELRKRAAKL